MADAVKAFPLATIPCQGIARSTTIALRYNHVLHISYPKASSARQGYRKRSHPRSDKHRIGAAMRLSQVAYPICADDDAVASFLEFIHTRRTAILYTDGRSWAPQIYVFLMDGSRTHMTRTRSIAGVFSLAMTPRKANHFFLGFTIRFLTDHYFVHSFGTLETLTLGG